MFKTELQTGTVRVVSLGGVCAALMVIRLVVLRSGGTGGVSTALHCEAGQRRGSRSLGQPGPQQKLHLSEQP